MLKGMKKSFAIAGIILLAGCAAPSVPRVDWTMTDGSKADGLVTLGIDRPAPKFTYDINQANSEASQRCKNWGYAGAETYREGQFPISVLYGENKTVRGFRVQYQCTGEAEKAPSGKKKKKKK